MRSLFGIAASCKVFNRTFQIVDLDVGEDCDWKRADQSD